MNIKDNTHLLVDWFDQSAKQITPELVAELFCNMDSSEQAKFFNHVGMIAQTWEWGGFGIQLQYVTEEDGLDLCGRRVMQDIGNYSHWGLSCSLSREVRANHDSE